LIIRVPLEMNHEISLQVKNQLIEIQRLSAQVEAFAREHHIPDPTTFQINLVLDELVTNVISYGYRDTAEHLINLRMKLSGEELTIVMEDDGLPFNPLEQAAPELDKPIAEKEVGGLGIFLVRKLVDSVEYRRQADKNILVMKKKTSFASPPKDHSLEIRETKSGDVWVLEFTGRFDALAAASALEKLSAFIAADKHRLVLDFSKLDYISSGGLQVLLVTLNRSRHTQGTIALCSLKDYLKDIFDITGFAKLFAIYQTRAEAIQALQAPG
jgi:anti-anti-sigma factor